MTAETRSPTSNSGQWSSPTNAYVDNINFTFCGNGEGGYVHDYSGYGFSAVGNISEVRVDIKGHSGDGTKHSINVYIWDGLNWHLIGNITSELACHAHQFDASSYIDTPDKLNNVKTRIESVGLSGGTPTFRYVRVCWIPVYADWSEGPTPDAFNKLAYEGTPSPGFNKLTYASEPPVPNAWNKMKYG